MPLLGILIVCVTSGVVFNARFLVFTVIATYIVSFVFMFNSSVVVHSEICCLPAAAGPNVQNAVGSANMQCRVTLLFTFYFALYIKTLHIAYFACYSVNNCIKMPMHMYGSLYLVYCNR